MSQKGGLYKRIVLIKYCEQRKNGGSVRLQLTPMTRLSWMYCWTFELSLKSGMGETLYMSSGIASSSCSQGGKKKRGKKRDIYEI